MSGEAITLEPTEMRRNISETSRVLATTSTLWNSQELMDSLEFGLMISIEDDGILKMELCLDKDYPEIHPNVYAPAILENMKALGGGGSGVAVFAGHHPHLGDLVMKHGGYNDMQELFALATIAAQVNLRSLKRLIPTIW